jgi:hypothetical protein
VNVNVSAFLPSIDTSPFSIDIPTVYAYFRLDWYSLLVEWVFSLQFCFCLFASGQLGDAHCEHQSGAVGSGRSWGVLLPFLFFLLFLLVRGLLRVEGLALSAQLLEDYYTFGEQMCYAALL